MINTLLSQPTCPSAGERIMKMWYMYTMEYYSAVKKRESRMFEGKWMDPEKITLSLVTQIQKGKCCISLLSVGPSSKSSGVRIYME